MASLDYRAINDDLFGMRIVATLALRSTFIVGLAAIALAVTACGGGGSSSQGNASTATSTSVVPNATGATAQATSSPSATPKSASTTVPLTSVVQRSQFLGAFFRPEANPPFGVLSVQSPSTDPSPYPTPGAVFTGPSGYCTRIMPNGLSIETGNLIDATKLNDIVALGVRWVRMPAPQFSDDNSHVFGSGAYHFGDFDSAQCSTLVEHSIKPIINLEAGPVNYNVTQGTFSPLTQATYQTAADFAQWCGVVAAHERAVFPSITQFTLPGNEVNTNPGLFPGGNAQIAAYSEACYAAIKSNYPGSYVYGFELNMDGGLNTPGFIQQMAALGCKVGTCYDGIAIHFSLRYPVPAAATPCYPNAGGDYGMQCIADILTAIGSPVRVLVSETVYPVPGYVPDEATKALAIVADFETLATDSSVDGVGYANVDECGLYPTGFFVDGCLISTTNQILPAYTALQRLAESNFQ